MSWVKRWLRQAMREARATRSESSLNEPAAHLMLLVATYVPDGELVSEWIPLDELTCTMHCQAITVRRARKLLEALGALRVVEGGQGRSRVRFEFALMAGPVFAGVGGAVGRPAEQPSPPTSISEIEVPAGNFDPTDRSTSCTSISGIEVTSIRKIDVGREPRSQGSKLGEPTHLCTSTRDLSTDDDDRKSSPPPPPFGSREQALTEVAEWWNSEYPTHHQGRLNVVDLTSTSAARAVQRLLGDAGGHVGHVKSLVMTLWTLRPDGHPRSQATYLATQTDHSIFVVVKNIGFLDAEYRRQHADGRPDNVDVWQHVLKRLELAVSRWDMATWFSETSLIQDHGDAIDVAAPNAAVAAQITRQYQHAIDAALNEIGRGRIRVEFVVARRDAGSDPRTSPESDTREQ